MTNDTTQTPSKRLRTIAPPAAGMTGAHIEENRYGMELAFARQLQTEAVDDYRKLYRSFRGGKAVGAKGERPSEHAVDSEYVSVQSGDHENQTYWVAVSVTNV